MSSPQLDLQGQVALITGASSGIGAALAQALARQGARVALAARRTARVEELAHTIQAAGGEALPLSCDVRDEAQVQAMVEATIKHFGGLDILIPNAGLGYRSPIIDADTERWKTMIDTNIYGVLLTLKYGVPHLIARGQGDVFLVSSVAGQVVNNGGGGYSATKFAVNAIGEALRQEMSRKNVRVTTLAPGVVISEFQEVALYPPGFVKQWLGEALPLQPEDIAHTVLAVLALPRHTSVNQIIIRPTGQTNP